MAVPPTPTNPHARPAFQPLQTSLGTSQTSSAFQSYNSSASSLNTPSSAPLPSPSAAQQSQPFFNSMSGQQQREPQAHLQQQQAQPSQHAPVFDYQPNRQGAGTTAAETANYLSQTALLAEAAKRAQMAVVMRDLDSMEL